MKPKFYAPILVFGMLLLAGCGSDKIQAPLPGGALDAADLRVLVEAAKQDRAVKTAEAALRASGFTLYWDQAKGGFQKDVNALMVPTQDPNLFVSLTFDGGALKLVNIVEVKASRPNRFEAVIVDLRQGEVYQTVADPSQGNKLLGFNTGRSVGVASLAEIMALVPDPTDGTPGGIVPLATCAVPSELIQARDRAREDLNIAYASLAAAVAAGYAVDVMRDRLYGAQKAIDDRKAAHADHCNWTFRPHLLALVQAFA